MDTLTPNFAHILNALPKTFGFYHLGRVELQAETDFLLAEESTLAVAFRLHGDLEAWIVILFEKNLDQSTYSELGNLLASKIATQLHAENGLGVMISPPRILESTQFEKTKRHSTPIFRRNYAHFYKNSVIPIETWVMPASSEEFGYA